MPGIAIDEIATNVRRSVVSIAKTINQDQRPAYYDEMLGKFYFAGPPIAAALPKRASAGDLMRARLRDRIAAATTEAELRIYESLDKNLAPLVAARRRVRQSRRN